MAGPIQLNESGVITSGENLSYWLDSVWPLEFVTLKKDIDTDVLIINEKLPYETVCVLNCRINNL